MKQKEESFLSRKYRNMLRVLSDKMKDARHLLRNYTRKILNNQIKIKYRGRFQNFYQISMSLYMMKMKENQLKMKIMKMTKMKMKTKKEKI